MENLLLIIHLMLALALIGLVLMQRSEGGALGIGGGGGGGGMGGFLTARGSANLLTRATAIVAALFILTSLSLAILASGSSAPTDRIGAGPSGGKTPISGTPKSGADKGGAAKTPAPVAPAPKAPEKK